MHILKITILVFLCTAGIINIVPAQIIVHPSTHVNRTPVVLRRNPTRFAFSNIQQRRLDSLLRIYKYKADSIKRVSGVNSPNLILLQAKTRQQASSLLTTDQKQNFEVLSHDTTMAMYSMELPAIKPFPFPPPKGYTFTVLDDDIFARCKVLGDANTIIRNAITSSNCNYDDIGYYSIPNGFVLVTKVEEINDDATSVSGADRFTEGQYETMNILDYFFPRKGYFRVFAFLVTDKAFNATNTPVTAAEGLAWIRLAANILPDAIKNKPFTPGYNCSVIVYEFRSEEANTHLSPTLSPKFSAQTHLQKSHIAESLHP